MFQSAYPVAATETLGIIEVICVIIQEHKFEGLLNLTAAEIRYIMIVSSVYPAGCAEGHIGEAAADDFRGLGAAITVSSLETFEVD